MPETVHVHAPHELTEAPHATSGRERLLELLAALLMSVATLGIAWSGYQAARWSGFQARNYAQANTSRTLANQAATAAGQNRLQDLLNFNRWLEVSTQGNRQLADLYERRFRPEFRPAFAVWLAGDPLHNRNAIATPLSEPQYRLADAERADALERRGDRFFDAGKDATEHADQYVFATVFFAAVLFFAGMSLRFGWQTMRVSVLVLGVVFFAYGVTRIASLPSM